MTEYQKRIINALWNGQHLTKEELEDARKILFSLNTSLEDNLYTNKTEEF